MTRKFLYALCHEFGPIVEITVGQNKRGYVMFDSQEDALAAKNAIEDLTIKQQNEENEPLFDR